MGLSYPLLLALFLLLLSRAESWSFAARALRRAAATACLVVVGGGVQEVVHAEAEPQAPVQRLTARELLSKDIAYRVQELEGDSGGVTSAFLERVHPI